MGSCSNKGVETKNGIQTVIIKPTQPEPKKNAGHTVEKSEKPPLPLVETICSPAQLVPDKPVVATKSADLTEEAKKARIREIFNLSKPEPVSGGPGFPTKRRAGQNPLFGFKFFMKHIKKDETPEAATAVISTPNKAQSDIEFINAVLKKHFIFNTLSADQVEKVIQKMKLFKLGPQEAVFTQNKAGRYFFIVAEGKLSVSVSDAKVSELSKGMSFGEGAMLQNVPRTASVHTLEPCSLWGLDREEFTRVLSEINSAQYEENKKFIENTEIFKELTNMQKEALIQEISILYFKQDATIIKEGGIGDLLYILKSGSAVSTSKGEELGKVSVGECFGEQALFFKTPQTATIKAEVPVTCIGITPETLTKVFGSKLEDLIYKNILRRAIRSNQYLKKLSKLQEQILVSSMDLVNFEDSSLVIGIGMEKRSDLLIVVKGALKYADKIVSHLGCVGDVEIINESTETWTTEVRASGKTIVACITKEGFENAIGGKYSESVGIHNKIRLLKHVPLLRNLTNEQLNGILQAIRVQEYANGESVFGDGDLAESLFIIKSGKVEIFKNGALLRTIGKNEYFGEKAILFDQPRSANAKAAGRVILFVLFREDFLRIVSEKIRKHIFKRMELQDESIRLQDLRIVKLLGKGMTGIVFLTVDQRNKNLYALKTVHRQKIYEYNMCSGIKLERKILLQLDHSFIMKLVKTFKDPKRIYFLTEYVRGMDLFDVIRKMNFISEAQCRFFVGSLLLVFEDLHEKSLVYRDLKPENVVVDDEGYLKVIDFGTAKFVNGKTYTVLGTPQYMAPEVILNTGYNYTADYWSLGVMMFEFLFGYVPFGEEDVDPMAVYEKVLDRNIVYPNIGDDVYIQSKVLIEQFLHRNPAFRDGGSVDSVKNHLWFKGFEWDLLLAREAKPPYVPKVSKYDLEIEAVIGKIQDFDGIIENEEEFKGRPEEEEQPGWDAEF